MEVTYATTALQRSCTVTKEMQKTFGANSDGVKRRIAQLRAAGAAEDVIVGVGKWHPLTNRGEAVYAGRVSANWRIVVQFHRDSAHVLEIVDYH